jgi:glycosyltransferase involved in cell wall biosynthesis
MVEHPQKKLNNINMNKLGIVIATYQRSDGKTPFFLEKALDSVFSQTYQNFKIYLIGDKYEDNDEFIKIISKYPQDKIYYENLSYAKERDSYINKLLIWSYGGVNAINTGIDKALLDGYEYICHLDHDDWWTPTHLEEINKCIELTSCDWMCTKSTYMSTVDTLPRVNSDELHLPFHPMVNQLIHSSVCMNFKKIPLKYKDVYQETKKLGLPADADLWERTREYIIKHNLKSYFINKLTCRHDEEGFEK